MKQNILKDKSYDFSVRIVKLGLYLSKEYKEFVLSRQVVRSGTSIGANIEEAFQGNRSRTLFISFLSRIRKHLKPIIGSDCCEIVD